MTVLKTASKYVLVALIAAAAIITAILAGAAAAAALREDAMRTESAPPTGRFVAAADVDLFIQEAGPELGTPVIFIHGTGAWSETWRNAMEAAAKAGYRAIALDVPPFGYSQRPSNGSYGREAQAARILGLMDALDLDGAVLVGHSYGAGATVEAAMRAPERFYKLIIVDGALGLQSAGGGTPILLRAFLNSGPIKHGVVAATLTNPLFAPAILKAFVSRKDAVTPERVELYGRPAKLEGTTQAVSAWLPTLLAKPRPSLSTEATHYQSLAIPTVLIWGETDSVTPVSQAEHLASLLPNATMSILPGIGHIPQLEDPSAFTASLLRALEAP